MASVPTPASRPAIGSDDSSVNEMAPRHPVTQRGEHVSHGLGAWRRRNLWLTLGALGVVYGDIGTSPLYAVRQSVLATGGTMPMPVAVMGAISLIFWSLMIVVTGKYICFVLRAHNRGEGGSLALAALAHRSPDLPRWLKTLISGAAVLGLSLFFGEALLTPAITVLAAVEGLRVEEPALEPLILPISLLILIGLFAIQSRGTGKIGRMLGPIILVWFIAIGVLGLRAIIETPDILWALNPAYGIVLFVIDPHVAFLALGSDRAGGHRLGSAVCRYRPFRRQADPNGVALCRAAGARAQLFRTGRGDPSRSRQSGEPVLHPRRRAACTIRWWCSPRSPRSSRARR